MASYRYFVVNSFTDRPFSGNPAAVCLLDRWLDDRDLLAIAGETHAPATSFLCPGDPFELRWFTPVVEEEMCGHGTLGAAWVALNVLRPGDSAVTFETRAGALKVSRAAQSYVMDLPARSHSIVPASREVEEAIGRPAEVHLRSAYHIAILRSAREVAELQPDLGKVSALELPGLIVSAPGDGFGCDIVTRYFAPAKGIPEDHVTGSAHAQIVPYWSGRLGKTVLTARQLSRRGGAMTCELAGDRLRVTARACLYLTGEIHF